MSQFEGFSTPVTRTNICMCLTMKKKHFSTYTYYLFLRCWLKDYFVGGHKILWLKCLVLSFQNLQPTSPPTSVLIL